MNAAIVSFTDLATKPYSPERMLRIERADRITRLLFSAKIKGRKLSVAEATEIVESQMQAEQLEKTQEPTKTETVSKPATPAKAANDDSAGTAPLRTIVTKAVVVLSEEITSMALNATRWGRHLFKRAFSNSIFRLHCNRGANQ